MKQSLLSLLVVFASASTALALTPAGVPGGYVVTPFGYYHSSCVHELAEGDILKPDDSVIQHANGALDGIQACAYAHYTGSGEAIAADAKDPNIKHSWIVDVDTFTTSSFGGLISEWKVPPAPKSNNGQTIYFFPGLQDYKGVKTIIQPVLGWNAGFWEIASWNCCESGSVFHSVLIRVKTGDTIFGEMYDNCKAGTLECSTWNIITEDVTSKKATALVKTSNFKQTFNWAFGNVLEVYSVVKCSDYPPTDKLTAEDVALYTDGFVKIKAPKWGVQIYKVTPECGYGAYGTESTINLTF
jgi:hypothetical protein